MDRIIVECAGASVVPCFPGMFFSINPCRGHYVPTPSSMPLQLLCANFITWVPVKVL